MKIRFASLLVLAALTACATPLKKEEFNQIKRVGVYSVFDDQFRQAHIGEWEPVFAAMS